MTKTSHFATKFSDFLSSAAANRRPETRFEMTRYYRILQIMMNIGHFGQAIPRWYIFPHPIKFIEFTANTSFVSRLKRPLSKITPKISYLL